MALLRIKKRITLAFTICLFSFNIVTLNAQRPGPNEPCGCQCPTPVSGQPQVYPAYSFAWQVPLGKECCPTTNAVVPVTGSIKYSAAGTSYQMAYWDSKIFCCCDSGPIT